MIWILTRLDNLGLRLWHPFPYDWCPPWMLRVHLIPLSWSDVIGRALSRRCLRKIADQVPPPYRGAGVIHDEMDPDYDPPSTSLNPPGAWWICPNEPRCPHGAALHDVYDFDDPRPTCCAEGCPCGQPQAPAPTDQTRGGA